MPFDHDAVVAFSKSFGLFYLVALSVIALAWTYWPSNKKKFEEAAKRPMREEEDRPWR
ncbi:MAG TPA: cbb3-type cytochrome c oxidase subunit 3 [Pseudorhizobium sp.]|nr:cbb3-type cytochrome c oxidase subunit 3 [Pseudorhizobium sp.]